MHGFGVYISAFLFEDERLVFDTFKSFSLALQASEW